MVPLPGAELNLCRRSRSQCDAADVRHDKRLDGILVAFNEQGAAFDFGGQPLDVIEQTIVAARNI